MVVQERCQGSRVASFIPKSSETDPVVSQTLMGKLENTIDSFVGRFLEESGGGFSKMYGEISLRARLDNLKLLAVVSKQSSLSVLQCGGDCDIVCANSMGLNQTHTNVFPAQIGIISSVVMAALLFSMF